MTRCPACERESECIYRCEHCGYDLAGVADPIDSGDDDDDRGGPMLVTDGGMPKVTTRVPVELLDDIETIADRHDRSRSPIIRQALREFVAEHRHDPTSRSHLRADGGRDVAGASRARYRIDDARSAQLGGVGDQAEGGCPHVADDDPLPCLDCLARRGDE